MDSANPTGSGNTHKISRISEDRTLTSVEAITTRPVYVEPADISGTTFGGYRLVRKIAEGGMGVVYEAIQTKLDRKVALKVLTPQLSTLPEFLKRFEREAKAAAALNHPNLVQVHDFGEAGGHHYMIMEFVEGEDLANYIERTGKLSVEEGLAVIEQAASALKAAYEKSIIHRDIKPSNLMRTQDGRIKVADLGLAKVLTENAEMTATGVGIGSPYFIAPEQAADASAVDHRVDIYSLGITLLFLLTGRRPFDGGTPYSIVLAHVNKDLPSGADLGTELPEAVERLIGRMAAKDPEDRYSDYDLLLRDIALVRAGAAPKVKPVALNRSAKKWIRVAAAAAAIVIGIIAGFLLKPASHSSSAAAKKEPVFVAGQNAGEKAPLVELDERTRFEEPPMERRREGLSRPGALRERLRGERGPEFEGELPGGPGGALKGFLMRPLGPPNIADPFPLAEGPISSMEKQAKELTGQTPINYMLVINAYHQILEKVGGTPEGRRFQLELDKWVAAQRAEASKQVAALKVEMETQLKNGDPRAAHYVWGKFPQTLRSRDIDEEIVAVLTASLPADYLRP